jgi:hypothetical protein
MRDTHGPLWVTANDIAEGDPQPLLNTSPLAFWTDVSSIFM